MSFLPSFVSGVPPAAITEAWRLTARVELSISVILEWQKTARSPKCAIDRAGISSQ